MNHWITHPLDHWIPQSWWWVVRARINDSTARSLHMSGEYFRFEPITQSPNHSITQWTQSTNHPILDPLLTRDWNQSINRLIIHQSNDSIPSIIQSMIGNHRIIESPNLPIILITTYRWWVVRGGRVDGKFRFWLRRRQLAPSRRRRREERACPPLEREENRVNDWLIERACPPLEREEKRVND